MFYSLLVLIPLWVNGQTGSIEGVVLDSETKESIIGAVVMLEAGQVGTTTDFDGLFVLRLAPGNYTLSISSLGFEKKNVTDIVVEAGKKTVLNIALATSSMVLDEVVVTEYKRTNTEASVLIELKQSKQVVSGISNQQIQKSLDANAAQVMQRIPGVTIVDNRFVMIRGLSERYNNVMINNVVAPSTEVDKRTFSFDLIASSALDRMLIYKSGSADLPGDFAGGVIKLFTIDNVDENFTQVNLGLGYRPNTTFSPYYQSEGSATDFLGFDNGFRTLPGSFPSSKKLQNSGRDAQLRIDAAHTLQNNFVPKEQMASPDYSLGFSMGRNTTFNSGAKLSSINTLSYSTSYLSFQRDFNRYFEWEDQDQPIIKRFQYMDDNFQKDNRIALLSNWNLKINDNHRIRFKNLFNQIGENETIIRNGKDFLQRPNDDLRNYLLGYRSRSIYTGQLEGDHQLNVASKLHWVAGGSYLREAEPDLRRFRTYRPLSNAEGEGYTMQLPPSSNLFETGRYFGTLGEFSLNQGMDYTVEKFFNGSAVPTIFKVGYYGDYRNRNFSSRYFSYLYPGFYDADEGLRISKLPLDQIFSNENVKTDNGLTIEEGTRPIDTYDASSILGAAYATVEIPFSITTTNAGVRLEHNVQMLNTADDVSKIKIHNPVTSILPFANVGVNLSTRSVVRLAYSKTINRPEFRELAPFLFYDYKLEAARVGNPNLKSANIQNLDLRYEFYPRNGELVTLGAFYKYFNDPIENRTIITTEQPSFTYINADWAQNYGLELEFRKSFRGITGSTFVDNFSINLNASVIYSKVDLGVTAVAQDRTRALQGQSPYIINAGLYYQDKKDLGINLVYNIFGERIYSVGDDLFPTIYELPRHSIDLILTKKVGRWTYKLGINDLLNARYRFYQDSDRNLKINEKDNVIFSYKRGQLFSLNLAYRL
ncbi:MAG: carboxypeptidase-like regulatory domain-containing protein [Saprospiraceae bacterium]|nr:carboxypeptidase-like regulatory domain-containing protein [Saprospiraceae bacterium]